MFYTFKIFNEFLFDFYCILQQKKKGEQIRNKLWFFSRS